jgi:hypothetical protein
VRYLAIFVGAFLSIGVVLVAAPESTRNPSGTRGTPQAPPQVPREDAQKPSSASETPTTPPSEQEIQQRSKKLIENQHKNDEALDEYERVERYIDRTAGSDSQPVLDKTYRMVPTGGGTMKVLVKDHGMPVDPALYDRQMKTLRDILQIMANPSDPKAKAAYDKYGKRKQERDVFVDVAQDAFLVKWAGLETRDGRSCDVFQLDPSPAFHPRTLFQEALAHVTAKIWVDRDTTQIVRAEAHALTDIYFGGGILGKLARGSSISMDQEPVAPGLWEVTHMEYNYSGRKFLFPFEQHQEIEAGHYKWIGRPKEALAEVQGELSSGKPFPGDP